MNPEKPQNSLENNAPKNPFEGHPLRALNIERMKTEERLDEIKEKMGLIKEDNPASFEEFKKLNQQKTLAEKSLGLINEAIEKVKLKESSAQEEEKVAMRFERDSR